MTEQGTASRFYAGNFPALPAGMYTITFYQKAGGSPDETDPFLGQASFAWSGSAPIGAPQLETSLAQVLGRLPAALVAGRIDANVGEVAAVTGAPAIADAVLDRSAGVEAGFTVRQALRIVLAALGGKLSGAATSTVVIRAGNDSRARITAAVDADGNRTSVTLDPT